MKVSQRLADDLQGQRLAQASSTGLQDDLSMGRPEMTSWNLGASEVQATHQRNIGSDEIRIGGLPQHLIILFTKPPREMNVRCELGFKTDLDHPSWVFSELAYITQLPKEFDFEHPLLPPQFHYTGPFHDGKGRHPVDFPWDRLTGEPLIYASMGTIMNGRADVFRTIAAGVAKHKGTQLVLSIGDRLDPKQIGPVPSNAIIVNQAPQLELLKRASFCITHAGLNTVLESLAQGVPQLAIPVTFEQPGIAARIAAKKTGVTMSFADLTSEHLSTLLDEVLSCPI